MSKFLKELKKNKYTTIAIAAFLLLIALGYGLYNLIVPGNGTPVYGDRLNGIDKVAISSSNLKKLNEKLMDSENIVEATSNVNGKIVNVLLTIKEGVKLDEAKKFTENIKQSFSEDQLAYFDIQVYIKNEDESYSVIGYKNKNSDSFIY